MSLVLEALRRVDKPGERTGSVGVAVASYRPARKRSRAGVPLLLGLATGGTLVSLFGFGSRAGNPAALTGDQSPPPLEGARPAPSAAAHKALPSMKIVESSAPVRPAPAASAAPDPRTQVTLILQAISERDSHPVAVINDQLVKEGDLIEGARVLRIHADSVEVVLENGASHAVRFAPPLPPPPPETSPSPGPF
jgi:hypothetical protein